MNTEQNMSLKFNKTYEVRIADKSGKLLPGWYKAVYSPNTRLQWEICRHPRLKNGEYSVLAYRLVGEPDWVRYYDEVEEVADVLRRCRKLLKFFDIGENLVCRINRLLGS